MKGNIKRKKRFWKPVMIVFAALYLVIMALATLLAKERIKDEYLRAFEEAAVSIQKKADISGTSGKETEQEEMKTKKWDDKKKKEFYQNLVNEYFRSSANPELMISAAFYDENKELMAKSCDLIGDTMYTADTSGNRYGPYVLEDFLTFEQKEKLAGYHWESMQSTEDYTLPEKYRILIRTSSDGQELYGIYVQELTWQEEEGGENPEDQYVDPFMDSIVMSTTGVKVDYATGAESGEDKVFRETDSKIVWEWVNPDVSAGQRENGEIQATALEFPYMGSYERWYRWSSSEFLHEFSEEGQFSWNEGEEDPGLALYPAQRKFYLGARYQLKIGMITSPSAYLDIRMEESPWFAAFDYMKYLYLMGLILTSACMFLVIIIFEKAYERQMALEEMRRDFTNAMAHELKTPLGIIRNFSENLIERNMEEKREYYLTQIIGQTEEMDHLAAEMIEISKLDSEELVLRKEPVSFGELVREQMERFELPADEKNLQIEFREEAEFRVDGDREYLAKAIWNLLSNAVEYNVPDGRILIRTDAKCCSIENTGKPIEEEQLLHAFDLFYTGNKSRGREGKHMGLGLFLAKKILNLHHLGLTIENTDEGIRTEIKYCFPFSSISDKIKSRF